MLSIKIAFLPWGDPSQWRTAQYCLEDVNGEEECAKGSTTLSLVVDKLGYSNLFILVPWTVIPSEKIYEIVYSVGEPIYDKLTHIVRDYIKTYAQGQIEKYCTSPNRELKVFVFPGVIRYFTKCHAIIFKTSIDNLVNYALYTLYNEVNNKLNQEESSKTSEEKDICLEALLDTTHGVNYFTLTVSRVLDEVLALIAVSRRCRVVLNIYNADPFRSLDGAKSSEDSEPKLYYHKIAERVYTPWHVSIHTKYRLEKNNSILKAILKDVGKENILRSAKHVVTAYRLGLVPFLIHVLGTNVDLKNEIKDLLSDTVKSWSERVFVHRVSCREIVVSTERDLTDEFRLLLHAHAISTGVSEFLKEKNYDLKKIVDEGVRLDDLEKLVETMYEGMEIINEVFRHECRGIRNHVGEIEEEWKLWADLIRKKKKKRTKTDPVEDCGEDEKMEPAKRHAIAHAGFNKNYIELKRIGNEIRVRVHCTREKDILRILDNLFNQNLVIETKSAKHSGSKQ